MKKLLFIAAMTVALASCRGNDSDANDKANNPSDPNQVHPEAEAVPDSMKIVRDSTIVSDSVAGNPTSGTE